jgi:hypothetical protein
MDYKSVVRSKTLAFCQQNHMKIDDVLNAHAFLHQVLNGLNPKEREQVKPVMDELTNVDRYFDERNGQYFLRQEGYDAIYD